MSGRPGCGYDPSTEPLRTGGLAVNVELVRSEVQRLLRQSPFQPFIITFRAGERALIEHPENVAFDPRPGSSSDFYVLTGSLRLFSTFDSVSSVAILSGGGTVPGEAAAG
jgi:hypothetical protein